MKNYAKIKNNSNFYLQDYGKHIEVTISGKCTYKRCLYCNEVSSILTDVFEKGFKEEKNEFIFRHLECEIKLNNPFHYKVTVSWNSNYDPEVKGSK